jgi:hypothetical protein
MRINMSTKILSSSILVILFFLLFSTEVITQTISSNGTGGNWNNVATWVGGVVPGVNNNVVINGTVYVNSNTTVRSVTVSVSAILENEYNAGATLTVTDSIINGGTIQVNPGYYSGFALSTSGNIINNGIWWPGWTTFTGSNTKKISSGSGKRFQGNFQSLDSNCTITATSAILFTQSFDLKKGILDMQTYALTLAASGNITNGRVNNTNDLILIEGAGISAVTYAGTPNLKRLVQVNGTAVIMEGTVTVTDTLQNVYNSGTLLTIKGSLTNNGIIRFNPGYYSGFSISLTNNAINNGIWAPNWTSFTGTNNKIISSAGGKRFEGNFQNTDSASTIQANSSLLFTGPFDLKKSTLNMQSYALTLAGSGNITNGVVINTNDLILIEGAGLSSITYIGTPNLKRLVQVNGTAVIMQGAVTVTDTLQNVYNSGTLLTINGSLTNNGIIKINPGYYSGFSISLTNNVINNGVWAPNWTTFTGTSTKEITLAAGKKFESNFQNMDSTSIIMAKSNLAFTLPFDLKRSTMDMASYKLSLSGSANVYNGKVINTKDLFLDQGASISSITYTGAPNLLGLVQINSNTVIFEGNVTVTDTLQNVYNSGSLLTIKGSLINNGIIKLNPGYYSGFSISVTANLYNSGNITSTPITLNGTTDQFVLLVNNNSIKNRVIFDSKLVGTNYIWYKNGISIGGATTSALNFDSLNTANYGTYQCSTSVGTSRYFYVQIGYLNVKDENPTKYQGGPFEFKLGLNYPNPFNPTTKIEYSLMEPRFTVIKIYGLQGNEIKTLLSEEKSAGKHSITFDGSGLPSGTYFYQIKAGDFVKTGKMLLLK